jgi:hypothetical protein
MDVVSTGNAFPEDTLSEVVSTNKHDGTINAQEIMRAGRLGAEVHTFRDGEHALLLLR